VALLLSAAAGSAQGPIGTISGCAAGTTYRVSCYTDENGYISDMQFSNTLRTTPVSLCGTPDWQLQDTQLQILELSASDTILRLKACTDSDGLRGLLFMTALGAELSCGTITSSCSVFSSRSNYPLRGFQGSCQSMGPSGWQLRGWSKQPSTRVTSVTGASWVYQQTASRQGKMLFKPQIRWLLASGANRPSSTDERAGAR
jgi:hypothetical protein